MAKPAIPAWQQAGNQTSVTTKEQPGVTSPVSDNNKSDQGKETSKQPTPATAQRREDEDTDEEDDKTKTTDDADSSDDTDSSVKSKLADRSEDLNDDDDILAQGFLSSDDDHPSGEQELTNMARRFLQDGTVQGAPREKKISFLVSKGVGRDKAGELVDELSIEEGSDVVFDPAAFSAKNPAQAASAVPAPIITYPEFLMHSQHPAPLLTTNRIGNIVTTTTALMAGMYTVAQYVVAPMIDSLGEARHDLYSTVHEKIEDLNGRLSETVSQVPSAVEQHVQADPSTSEDGPALFQRSIGVQTSPTIGGIDARGDKAGPDGHDKTKEDDPDTIAAQHSRLTTILSSLHELSAQNTLDGDAEQQLDTAMSSIKGRFYELAHSRPVFHSYPYMFGSTQSESDAEDPFKFLKEDIRGMKGSLLSPRSFSTRRVASHSRGQSGLGLTARAG